MEPIISNFIDGKFVEASLLIDSYNPATGKVWARVPDSTANDVEHAVKAAKSAFPLWSMMPAKSRAMYLNKIADSLESRLAEFAEAESRDQGKPFSLAKTVDIPRAVHNFRFFASACLHTMGVSTQQPEFGTVNYTTHSPVGVAGLISPWNLPLYLLTFKIAPALAFGNTVVAKPSEMTSVTAWMLCTIFQECGLPPGVVNIVFGFGPKVGEAIVTHPDIRLISFTGSTVTGSRITEASASLTKKLSLELGGKNCGIVFDDADMRDCIPGLIRGSFTNQGEICLCTSRIFVQTGIYQNFVEEFVQAARKLRVGDPLQPGTNMGALISHEHLDKVRKYIHLALSSGGTVRCGEGIDPLELAAENKEGYFMRPTVIVNLPDTSPCMQEEIFGPVTCIVPFESEAEVIIRANTVKYGLCASIWSSDVGKIHRVANRLEVGTVWCNCWLIRDLNMPFGGIKSSGVGFEGFHESFEFFTNPKTICIKVQD